MNAIVREPRARLPHRTLVLSALAAWLLACGGVERPAGQPLLPPIPPAAPATSEPAIHAQVFAESGPDHTFTDPDRRKKLESAFPAIDALVETEVAAQKLPGAVFGVVVDGDLAHARGFGVTDLETKAQPDADTIYRLGSITKSFTALAVLALRDDGALALDEPLTRLLPEASGLVYPTRDTPPITLRQLLTHSSGLPRLGHFDYTRQGHAVSEDEIMKSLSGFALESPPGTRYHYSNLGYGLLGVAVGRASRTSVRAVIGEKILQPLGMTSTGWDRAGVPAARIATPYKRAKSGALEPTFTWELGASEGAGGLYSSLRDTARYVAFQLSAYPPRSAPEAASIRRSSIREAHFNALRSGGLRVRQREAPPPGESTVAATASSYAYAWGVSETCELDRVVRHNGAVAGFSAAVSFLPESGVGIVALTNLSADGVDLESVITKALLALKKTGRLAKRVPSMKALSPALAAAVPRLLAVQNTWSEEGYRAMLSKTRGEVANEQEELAGYRSTHGACNGFSPTEIFSPVYARFAVQCERGALEMHVQIQPTDGLITGFWGISRDIPAPPPLAKAADRLASLIGQWDDAIYKKHLAPKATKPRADTAAFFEKIRAAHGSCEVKSFTRFDKRTELLLGCARGGELTLTLALDEKSDEVITRYTITPRDPGPCPVQ